MNLEQLKARLAEISARMAELNGLEQFSNEDVTEINSLSAEFDSVRAQIEAKEKVAQIAAAASTSARKTVAEPTAAAPRVEVVASRKEKMGGFNSFGEFLGSIRFPGS
jgi:septal ring factor EnvC (AmiA/AmiB activator)